MADGQRGTPRQPARRVRRRSLLALPAAAVVGLTLATASPANAQTAPVECAADLMAGL
jgi:hypothetical protein